ncbi:hypothetical protein OIU79_013627 [Salix purpurea]|uniref:Uncharacterized protein n=1 Tax=Salix purpurea TaxID=77065 RepID=A0A9Q0SW46_SALPP|nr:hypothetical protein OIU79_013627 [Salix purpurea]
MLLLEAEQYSIVKYRAMKQKSSHHILNHVLYHKKVELRLASNIPEVEVHRTCLFVCAGKHVIHVNEVPFARSSLNHDDILFLIQSHNFFNLMVPTHPFKRELKL